jgi:hypothetical protein
VRLIGKEVETFGWWFASEQFDWGWAEAQAVWVLGNGSTLEPDHVVVESLQERVKDDPLAAVRILMKIRLVSELCQIPMNPRSNTLI